MMERRAEVELKNGLQARQAALFVQKANSFLAEVSIEKGGKRVNAKSIMGVMSLAIENGADVSIAASGTDEERAVEELAAFIGGAQQPSA